jgi:hypothetical protein
VPGICLESAMLQSNRQTQCRICMLPIALACTWPLHACLRRMHTRMQRTKDIVKISLGACAVNELLGGGLESRCITEIYGEFRRAALPALTFMHGHS